MKLRVENLARIKKAEVEVKNLTLFVGQNSTHKSYMTHTIYELFKEISSVEYTDLSWKKRKKLVNFIMKNIEKEDLLYFDSFEIDIISHINENRANENDWFDYEVTIVTFLNSKNDKKIKEIINKIQKLIFKELKKIINASFNVNTDILKNIFIANIEDDLFGKNDISLFIHTPLEYFDKDRKNISIMGMDHIIERCIEEIIKSLNGQNVSHYFPASRTGFVLTLDEIYAGIFRDKFRGQVSSTRLGEPTIDFIQTFADIKTNQGEFFSFSSSSFEKNKKIKLINFLETNIIKGKIEEVKNEQDYTTYYLNINGIRLDLHLASSATLETLPFIVFIKNTVDISKTLFVIEEPEAHLHPKAQVKMAKFLVMLSNTGAKVIVTTHSDYILNEINNCIKLNAINKEDDFSISKDNVSAYLFKNEENETTVNELKIDKYGIANDNFDKVLDELLDRSSELTETIMNNE